MTVSTKNSMLSFEGITKIFGDNINTDLIMPSQYLDNPDMFPTASYVETVDSWESGFISEVHAREIGLGAMTLGAGRESKGDPIDHSVGIVVHKKVGQIVEKSEALFTIHSNDEQNLKNAIERTTKAFKFSKSPVDELPLFYRTILS